MSSRNTVLSSVQKKAKKGKGVKTVLSKAFDNGNTVAAKLQKSKKRK